MRWSGIKQPKDISSEVYLVAKPEPVMRLPENRKKVGICWASGNHFKEMNERRRVVPLTLFLPLLSDPSVSVISLQVGAESKDIINNGLEGIIFDPTMKIENFSQTADLIASLDMVISVDSAVAHLAGAIGKPVLMLSPFSRCWRWWGQETGWPWYSRMRIYPQEQNGSWARPMAKATKDALWMMK
jgi:ADP-heptose:LPS heptosyltransferase